MQKWEYTWFTCSEASFSEDKLSKKGFSGKNGAELLDELGRAGWELVSTIVIPNYYHEGYLGSTDYVRYILKRPSV